MSFQKDLIQFYVDKLNTINSSFPSGHDFVFRTGYLIQKTDLKFEFDTYPTYYSKETTQFIPVMVDTIDRPRNIPEKDVTEWTLSLQFLLVGESDTDPYFVEQYTALEAFRKDLVDVPIGVVNSALEKYLVVHSSTTINRSGGISILNGKKVIPVGIQIFATTSKGLHYGNNLLLQMYDSTFANNEWTIAETPTAIVPLEFIVSSVKTLESEMEFGETFATSVPLNRFLDFSVRVNLDTQMALTNSFMNDILGGVGIDKPYKLRFSYISEYLSAGLTSPIPSTFYEFEVLLESGVAVFSLGGITTLDLRFKVKYGE